MENELTSEQFVDLLRLAQDAIPGGSTEELAAWMELHRDLVF